MYKLVTNFATRLICNLYIPLALPDVIIIGGEEQTIKDKWERYFQENISSSSFFLCEAWVICLGVLWCSITTGKSGSKF